MQNLLSILKKIRYISTWFIVIGLLCYCTYFCYDYYRQFNEPLFSTSEEYSGHAVLKEYKKEKGYKNIWRYTILLEGENGSPSIEHRNGILLDIDSYLDLEIVWGLLRKVEIGERIPVKWIVLKDGTLLFSQIKKHDDLWIKDRHFLMMAGIFGFFAAFAIFLGINKIHNFVPGMEIHI